MVPFVGRQNFAALVSISLAGLVWLVNKFARSSEKFMRVTWFFLKKRLEDPKKPWRILSKISVRTETLILSPRLVHVSSRFVWFAAFERSRTLELLKRSGRDVIEKVRE